MKNPYNIPTDFVIETNTNCNLNCAFCARQFTDMKHEPTSLSDFKKLLKNIPSCNIVRLGVQGEPLLYQGNFEIMQYLREIGMQFSITTNATVLTDKVQKKIPRNCVCIYASVDAGSQEVYSVYRDNANFNTWKENVINLRKKRPHMYIQVNYLLFKRNLYDIPKMIDFCAKYNLALSSTFPVIFRKEFAKEHDAFWLDNLNEIITLNRKYAQVRGVRYLCSSGNIEWRRCDLPWKQPLIGIQGDVYSDFFIYQPRNYDKSKPIVWEEWYRDTYKEVPQHEYIMGNIYEDNFKDIWDNYTPFLYKLAKFNDMKIKSSDFKKLYDNYPTQYSQDNPKCTDWNYCNICGRRWGYSY